MQISVKYNTKGLGPRVEVAGEGKAVFVVRLCAEYNGKRVLIHSRYHDLNHWFTFYRSFYTPWVVEFWKYDAGKGMYKIYEDRFNLTYKNVAFYLETEDKIQALDYVLEIQEFCNKHNCRGFVASSMFEELKRYFTTDNLHFVPDITQEELDKSFYTNYVLKPNPNIEEFTSPYNSIVNEANIYTWDSPRNPDRLGFSNRERARDILTGVDWDNNDLENGTPKHFDPYLDIFGKPLYE